MSLGQTAAFSILNVFRREVAVLLELRWPGPCLCLQSLSHKLGKEGAKKESTCPRSTTALQIGPWTDARSRELIHDAGTGQEPNLTAAPSGAAAPFPVHSGSDTHPALASCRDRARSSPHGQCKWLQYLFHADSFLHFTCFSQQTAF